MNAETAKLLFAFLRSAICGDEITDGEFDSCTPEELLTIAELSVKHDLGHLVAFGLKENKVDERLHQSIGENDELKNAVRVLEHEMFKAVYRYQQMNHELLRMCAALEAAEIEFMPLKGSVIRNHYPKPWMRTSCDIDVLVHDRDIERAKDILVQRCKYEYDGKSSHDLSFYARSKVHIELHYDLAGDLSEDTGSVLSNVWSNSTARRDYRFWREMSNEMFYFYHFAHMAKHFSIGGCGVRPFLDICVMRRSMNVDEQHLDYLLKSGGIAKFSAVAENLSNVWFGGGEHTAVTRQMENYILRGGVYGNVENMVAVQQQKRGGRVSYALSRIFIPYEKLKYSYPVLENHRWLTPIMEVRRWFRLIFCGHAKRSIDELKINGNISKQEAEATRMFLSEIGL